MVVAGVLKLVHVVAAVALLVNFVALAAWKVSADRGATPAQRAFVLDRVHALDRRVTTWAGIVAFGTGYFVIRGLGLWGGSIAGAPWALLSLVLMTLGALVWYFVMLPLEVRMADAAEREAGGAALDAGYGRWSAVWTASAAGLATLVLVIAALMVFKPALWLA